MLVSIFRLTLILTFIGIILIFIYIIELNASLKRLDEQINTVMSENEKLYKELDRSIIRED